jgi:hypothetical protein
MAIMTEPSPSLNASVLHVLLYADVRGETPVLEIWRRLTEGLSERDAASLPTSVERVLPLLAADRERLGRAVDLVVAFDLYEATPTLVSLAGRTRSSDLALAAAWFSSHPGVSSDVRAAAAELRFRLELSERQMSAFQLRLAPSGGDGKFTSDLMAAAWPGRVTPKVPLIYFYEEHAPPLIQLHLLGEFLRIGMRVRRVPVDWRQDPLPDWWAPSAHFVIWSERAISQLRQRGLAISPIQVVRGPTNEWGVADIVRRLSGGAAAVKRGPSDLLRDLILTREVMQLGALDIRDMAYLGGSDFDALYRLSRNGLLRPRHVLKRRRTPLWSYAQLVAFRTWRIFAVRSRRRAFSPRLVTSLEELASAEHASEIGFTSDGRLLRKHDSIWEDYQTGQEVFGEVIAGIDEVFQPFTLGGGHAPDLLRPSGLTRVDPATLGGTPFTHEGRVAARGLAEIERAQGRGTIRALYAGLSEETIDDAVSVGLNLLGTK